MLTRTSAEHETLWLWLSLRFKTHNDNGPITMVPLFWVKTLGPLSQHKRGMWPMNAPASPRFVLGPRHVLFDSQRAVSMLQSLPPRLGLFGSNICLLSWKGSQRLCWQARAAEGEGASEEVGPSFLQEQQERHTCELFIYRPLRLFSFRVTLLRDSS